MHTPHSLTTYRKHAKEMLRQISAGDEAAIQRFRATSTALQAATTAEVQAVASLMRCQHVIAVEQGAQSWADLITRIGDGRPSRATPGSAERFILGYGSRWSASFVQDIWRSERVTLGTEACVVPLGAFPRHLAVMGDCGRGKSTFLRHLTAQVMGRREATVIVITSKFEPPWASLCSSGRAIQRTLAPEHLEVGGWDRPGMFFYADNAPREDWGTSEATGRIVAALKEQPPHRECWVIIDEPLLDLPVRGAGVPWVEPGSSAEGGAQVPRLPSSGPMHLITCSQTEPDPRAFHQPDACLMFSTRHRDLLAHTTRRMGDPRDRSAVAAALSDAPIGCAVLANGEDSWVIAATGAESRELSDTTWAI